MLAVTNLAMVRKSSRLCGNSRFVRKRARSERIFAIDRPLIAQNGRKFHENWIGQLGVRVFTQSARVSQRGIRPKNRAFLRDARAEARRNHGLPPFGSLLAKLTAGQATTGASTTQSELYNQLSPQLETEQATRVCAPRGERYLEVGEVHIETDVSS